MNFGVQSLEYKIWILKSHSVISFKFILWLVVLFTSLPVIFRTFASESQFIGRRIDVVLDMEIPGERIDA